MSELPHLIRGTKQYHATTISCVVQQVKVSTTALAVYPHLNHPVSAKAEADFGADSSQSMSQSPASISIRPVTSQRSIGTGTVVHAGSVVFGAPSIGYFDVTEDSALPRHQA